MKKDTVIIIMIVVLSAFMYALTLRGAVGTPSAMEIKQHLSTQTQAFEASPERGRYVHVVSLAENGTYALENNWASVAFPDVGVSPKGEYFGFFAPGVAYMSVPFYLIGKYYGVGQVGSFSIESIFSIIALVFIFLIARNIFLLPQWAAIFSVLVYGFASTSWSYAVTLYQNAFTACFIVTAYYAVWKYSNDKGKYSFLYAAYVWLAYALAITVDYPNGLLFLPVLFYLAYVTFEAKKLADGYAISIRWASFLTAIVFVLITGLQLWHNNHYYGGWTKLAGTLQNYTHATTSPALTDSNHSFSTSTKAASSSVIVSIEPEKTVTGFFSEKHFANGFYVLLFSDERGLFYFTPIFLLAIFGIRYKLLNASKNEQVLTIIPLVFISMNVLLYSSWGDPEGGWAYGPRYLIPSMPWLALFVGIALHRWGKGIARKIFAYLLFLYSLATALLGVITTNSVPTKSEGLLLPAKKFNFLYNLDFLQSGKSGSFVYKTFLDGHISLITFFFLIYCFIAVLGLWVLHYSLKNAHE